MEISEKIREPATRIGGAIRSMPVQWYEDRADEVEQLEAELASVTASDKDAWAWVEEICDLLDCGTGGVFEIKPKIERLRKIEDAAKVIDEEWFIDYKECLEEVRALHIAIGGESKTLQDRSKNPNKEI